MFWLQHLALYSMIGWTIEILFTSFHSAIIDRNPRAIGTTYIYMGPVYGGAGLLFEAIKHALVLGTMPLLVRVLAYLIIIYVIEYVSGWSLKKLIGKCPWSYKPSKWTIGEFVRLDYAPFWLILAFSIEPIQGWLEKMFCG